MEQRKDNNSNETRKPYNAASNIFIQGNTNNILLFLF